MKNEIELSEEIYNEIPKSKELKVLEEQLNEIEKKIYFIEHKEKTEVQKFAKFIIFIHNLTNTYKDRVMENKISCEKAIEEIKKEVSMLK